MYGLWSDFEYIYTYADTVEKGSSIDRVLADTWVKINYGIIDEHPISRVTFQTLGRGSHNYLWHILIPVKLPKGIWAWCHCWGTTQNIALL